MGQARQKAAYKKLSLIKRCENTAYRSAQRYRATAGAERPEAPLQHKAL